MLQEVKLIARNQIREIEIDYGSSYLPAKCAEPKLRITHVSGFTISGEIVIYLE